MLVVLLVLLYTSLGASLISELVKNLPSMQETLVQFLGQEDPLEKAMAPHSSTLAWKIPWMEEPIGYSPWGHKVSDTTERLHSLHFSSFCTSHQFIYKLFDRIVPPFTVVQTY